MAYYNSGTYQTHEYFDDQKQKANNEQKKASEKEGEEEMGRKHHTNIRK